MADRNEYLEDPMWYVVHTYSGYENKVKTNIDKSIQNLHLEDQILDVQVPVQEVIEVKDGKKKTVQKKLFPGYVLLHMIMNDETWYVVRNPRGVTGFVGPESKPVPLTEEEIIAMVSVLSIKQIVLVFCLLTDMFLSMVGGTDKRSTLHDIESFF